MNDGGRIDLPARPRILVVSLRRLGDVLLTTPLIRSLRAAWPDAWIDALVFADTAGILEGNPDLDGVVAMPVHSSGARGLSLAARLWRKYDLAISTQTGDRPTFFAVAAGRVRIAPVDQTFNGRLKRAWLQRSVPFAERAHRVEQILRLADAMGIARVPQLVVPRPRAFAGMPAGDYAVIHAAPVFRYKQWTMAGWRAVAAALAARGLGVIATGGPAEAERRYLDVVWAGVDVTRLDGGLDWPQLAGLLSKARVYVGPDTSVTHLAAAAGCATVAIYGPDRSAAVGAVARGQSGVRLGSCRLAPASRQCLAGAKPVAVHAVPARRLRAPARQRQRVPRRPGAAAGYCRSGSGAWVN